MGVRASHWTKIKDLFLSDKEEFLLTTVDKGCSRHQLDKPTDDESTTTNRKKLEFWLDETLPFSGNFAVKGMGNMLYTVNLQIIGNDS